MEKILSKKSYKTFHKTDKINIRKDEYVEKAKPVVHINAKQSVFDKSALKNLLGRFFGWFSSKSKLEGKVAPKKSNKEMKCRTAKERAKRNTARESRKVNGHRGKRHGK